MTHFILARDALALLCGLQGAATAAIDLNRTHATNVLWVGHARFHIVWQTANTAVLSVLELLLLLVRGPFASQRFFFAAMLAAVPMLGFLAAVLTRRIYGGTLYDPNGIRPAKFAVLGRNLTIDLNTAVVSVGLVVLIALVAIAGGRQAILGR